MTYIEIIESLTDFEYALIDNFEYHHKNFWESSDTKKTHKLPAKCELVAHIMELSDFEKEIGLIFTLDMMLHAEHLFPLLDRIQQVRALNPQTDEEFATLFKLIGGAD